MPVGIPAPFDPKIAAEICELTADGKPMPTVAATLGISTWVIGKWRRLHPLFRQAMDSARDDGVDAMVDEYQSKLESGKLEPHQARVQGDFIRWLAACRSKRYRPAQEITLNTPDLGATLIEARSRALRPIGDLAQLPESQVLEFRPYDEGRTTDNESAPLPDGMPNPFD